MDTGLQEDRGTQTFTDELQCYILPMGNLQTAVHQCADILQHDSGTLNSTNGRNRGSFGT